MPANGKDPKPANAKDPAQDLDLAQTRATNGKDPRSSRLQDPRKAQDPSSAKPQDLRQANASRTKELRHQKPADPTLASNVSAKDLHHLQDIRSKSPKAKDPSSASHQDPAQDLDLAQTRATNVKDLKRQDPPRKPQDPRKAQDPRSAKPQDLRQANASRTKELRHQKPADPTLASNVSAKDLHHLQDIRSKSPKAKDPSSASHQDPAQDLDLAQTRATNVKDLKRQDPPRKPQDPRKAQDPRSAKPQDLRQANASNSKDPRLQKPADPNAKDPRKAKTNAKDPHRAKDLSAGLNELIGSINSGASAQIAPYFQNHSSVIFNDDCLDVLARLPNNCVDMVFADPPYMLSNDGFTCKNGKMASVNKGKWDKSAGLLGDLDFHRAWIAACRRVLKPSGTIWISGTYHSIYSCGFLLQEADFVILNDIAWFKPNAAPNLSCRYFTASHETLIWARKDRRAKHIFNYSAMKNGSFLQDKLKKPNTQMRSVWSIPTPPAREKTLGHHPTQKPLALLERVIAASTNPGDTILDPFSGAGTTALAATKLGRHCIGIDLNRDYCELAKNRLIQAT
ncbi:MAG: DNA methyltransferase [Helicobacteraceae bacterium]